MISDKKKTCCKWQGFIISGKNICTDIKFYSLSAHCTAQSTSGLLGATMSSARCRPLGVVRSM